MMHNVPVDHNMEYSDLSSDHTQIEYEIQTADMECGVFHGSSGDTQESNAQCCSSMCTAVVLLTFGVINDSDVVHAHLALPYLVKASAERTHLIRPPNL